MPLPEVNCDSICHTEFASTGLSLIDCGWKLKGPRGPPGGGGGPIVPMLLDGDGTGELMELKRPGNTSNMGDRESGSKVTVECIVRGFPPIPRPSSGSSGMGVGGVGVLGGAGVGRLDAMATFHGPRGSMGRSARKKGKLYHTPYAKEWS